MYDWKKDAKNDLRHKANVCLAYRLAQNDKDVRQAIYGGTEHRKFMPMPRHGYKGFEWCFFLPMEAKGKLRSLALFILVNRARRNCMAFRFEKSSRGRHAYAHVQLTSKLKHSGLPKKRVTSQSSCLLEWLPDSYPAFPIPAENWTEMFLAMATAVHGWHGGIDVLIQEIFQQGGEARHAREYMNLLANRLSS